LFQLFLSQTSYGCVNYVCSRTPSTVSGLQ
jgi:hypothetical protein